MTLRLKMRWQPALRELEARYRGDRVGLTRTLEKAVGRAAGPVRNEAIKEAPKAHGTLARSIIVKTGVDGDGRVWADVGPEKRLAPYGAGVEFGRRPHSPNWAKMEDWARRKGIPKGRLGAIFLSIKRKGTKANPFLQRAGQQARPKVNRVFALVINEHLGRKKP